MVWHGQSPSGPIPTRSVIPSDSADPLNRRILSVAEDQLTGFHPYPFDALAQRCGLPVETVLERLRAMLEAGTVRRIRQTLLSTSLAEGALLAWKVPDKSLGAAFEWLKKNDPFTGHIVIRSSQDPAAPGAEYRLWTTLKVPIGYGSIRQHCDLLSRHLDASSVIPLPVVGMFALGVGHIRRAHLRPGDKLPEPPQMQRPAHPQLNEQEWQVLLTLKESLAPHELVRDPWAARARALGMSPDEFHHLASQLDKRHVIGRFATFLDHTTNTGTHSGTGASGLFHWTVPEGREEETGRECGRHICMTHCYWRSGGEAFGGAQIMGVVHASNREKVLAHKNAIDTHLKDCGIPLLHTAVFWSEQAEIRPSEISPARYKEWLAHTS